MSVYECLYDWQKKIVDSAAEKKMYGLFLDMGTGKTVQALAIAEKLRATKVLIVTKKAKAIETVLTPGSWHQWASRLEGDWQIVCRGRANDGTFVPGKRQVYITNYESIPSRKEMKQGHKSIAPLIASFVKGSIGDNVVLILDESHCIKDSTTKQSRALAILKSELLKYASDLHVYLLTGTPFTTGFIDVFNQLKYIGCPMTKASFRDTFCKIGSIPGLLGWQQPIIGYKNLPLLYELIHKYAITVKSSDVVKLPEQIFEEHLIPPSPFFKALTKERISITDLADINRQRLMQSLPPLPQDFQPTAVSRTMVLNPWFRNIGYPNEEWIADTPSLLWLRARQLSIGFQGNAESALWFDNSRMEQIKTFLEDNPNNYVIFYNYTPEFYALFDIVDRLGYRIDVYNGEIKSLYFYDRYANQSEEEQCINKHNVILANFASGSTGMNWQLYSKCIIASLPPYKDWAQGLKRLHRVGQTSNVEYHIFRSTNWLDDGMWSALMQNVEYTEEMFEKSLNENSR